jgi:hypothetical protein
MNEEYIVWSTSALVSARDLLAMAVKLMNLGKAIIARMLMITMIVTSSMSVNPSWLGRYGFKGYLGVVGCQGAVRLEPTSQMRALSARLEQGSGMESAGRSAADLFVGVPWAPTPRPSDQTANEGP